MRRFMGHAGNEMTARIGAMLLITGCFTGCASFSSFQDARTVDKGTARMLVAATSHTAVVDSATAFEDPSFYVIDVGARVGLTKKFDIGLKYTLPGSMVGDAKYMFTSRESKVGFSTGFSAGYTKVEVEFSDSSGNSTATASSPTTIDATIPLYFSVYPLNWLSFTVEPHATYRWVIGGWLTAGPIVGANGDLKIGNRGGLLLEGGWHKALEKGGPYFFNYSAAIFFPFSLGFEDLVKDATNNF
jgi:hypothetical protein